MILCFDIGGTTIKPAIAHAPDRIEPLPLQETPLSDFAAFVEILRQVMAETGETPERIALSITGIIDPETGVATVANIPCLHGRRLGAELEAALSLEVLVANDADCFALAEAGLGAGRGHRIVLGAILGSGVGGGLVVDGHLVNAAGGFAGEWGHGPALAHEAGNPPMVIAPYACACGQVRCVNTIGGARGMERLHREIHGADLSSREIVRRWRSEDRQASRTIDIYVDLIASPLAVAINITGASIVPVGGGLSNSVPLISAIDKTVRSRTLRKFDRPLVVPSVLKLEPGLIGAALLGLQRGTL